MATLRVTVFGAGAMGTAVAMHLARAGNDAVLWGSPYDEGVLPDLVEERRHPALPEYLPESLKVLGPDQLGAAADGIEIAVMGAHSGGARTLAEMVVAGCDTLPFVVGVAKGLEPGTGKRMSLVYAEEVGHDSVAALGGPCLAAEVAQGLPTAAVLAAEDLDAVERVAGIFRTSSFQVATSTDVAGVEYCTLAKNVAAIALGILDGLAKMGDSAFRNAKAALFTQGVHELVQLVVALGGRAETAFGLAGLGDALVTSLGGRNRLYGELVGEGADPARALEDLTGRGMTVEGVDAAREVRRLTEERGLDLPLHRQVQEILFEGAPAASLLSCLKA